MTTEEQAQANMSAEGAPAPAQEPASDAGQTETGKTGDESQAGDPGGTVKHTRIGGAPPVAGASEASQIAGAAVQANRSEASLALDAKVKDLTEELDTLQPADQSQGVRLRCGPADRRLGLIRFDDKGNAKAERLAPRQSYDIQLAPGEKLIIVHLAGDDLREYLRFAGMAPGEPA